MSGLQNGTNAPGSGQMSDNLDVVLGRFQKWAKSPQAKVPSKAAKSRTPPVSTKARLSAEAREISYEQALQASSYRRPLAPLPLDPLPLDTSPLDTLPDPVTPKIEAVVASAPVVDEPAAAQFEPGLPSRGARHATKRKADAPALAARLSAPYHSSRPVKPSATGSASLSKPGPAKTRKVSAPAKSNCGEPVSQAVSLGSEPILPEASSSIQVRFPAQSSAPANLAFRDVLQDAECGVSLLKNGAVCVESKQSAVLTLQVSEAEQKRIENCAAGANLSISAYLRQCALGVADLRHGMEAAMSSPAGVEDGFSISACVRHCALGIDELRDQVEVALAQLQERPSAKPGGLQSEPGIAAIPGILGRFAFRCFGLRRREEQVGLSIR